MREIRTSSSVRGEQGNLLTYSTRRSKFSLFEIDAKGYTISVDTGSFCHGYGANVGTLLEKEQRLCLANKEALL